MSNLSDKFNIPPALFETIKKMNFDENVYQDKLKSLLKKRGFTSIGQMSPEEKKDFFNTLDTMHKAKHEEVELEEISVVKTNKPIGTRVADIGPGSKEYNVKINKAYDNVKKKKPQGAFFATQRRKERLASSGRMDEEVELEEGYEKVVLDFLKKRGVDAEFKSGKLMLDKQDMAIAKKALAKPIGFSAKDLEIVAEESVKSPNKNDDKNKAPFDGGRPVSAKKSAVAGKHGSGYSIVKHLAKTAMKKQMSKEEVVDEATGDKPFDNMMKTIKKGTAKQATVDRNKKRKQSQQQARAAFGSSPANRLSIRKPGVAEEVKLDESHFKLGDKVKCTASGMKGKVIKVDPEEKGKYYTVRQDSGKIVKYAPDELKKVSDVKEACWDTHTQVGMKKKGDRMVPNCVPKSEVASKTMKEVINPQTSMKRAALSMDRAKEVGRHQSEITSIRKKRESLRNSYDPIQVVREAVDKMKKKRNENTVKDNAKGFKSGEKLSGKTEPVEINPELKEQKS